MTPPDDDSDLPKVPVVNRASQRRDLALLLLICLSFFLLRLPVMYLQPGGQDEDCYAVPGLTIAQSGIPRLPHVPARNRDSVYFHADEQLYSEPPLYFYYQSLFYLVLPAVYGTARLSSAIAGIVLLVLVYRLCVQMGCSSRAALWSVLFLSLSRWFYFPAICARPDMLCATLGIAVVLTLFRWQETRRHRELVVAGVLIGLGGLTHPFAIVYAVQAAVWVMLASRNWRRLANPAVMAVVAIACCCIWLPLIAMAPEAFRVQFHNQFFTNHEMPLWQRFLLPFESIAYHAGHVWDHIGTIQMMLTLASLSAASIAAWRANNRRIAIVCCLAWSSIYLMCAVVGPHHPVFGYFVYFAALVAPCFGMTVEFLVGLVPARSRHRQFAAIAATGLIVMSLIPGSGLRTLAVHLSHLGDVNYNSPRFAKELIAELPSDKLYAVDTQFVLDFVAADRRTILAATVPFYFRAQDYDYDYLIVSRTGERSQVAAEMNGEQIGERGLKDDIWACYAEIYRRRK